MPVFKLYDETGKLISERRETASEGNIEMMIAQYGEEKTAVYMDALYDIYSDLDDMTLNISAHMTRRKLGEYLKEKQELLLSKTVQPLLGPTVDLKRLEKPPYAS